MCGIAEVEVLNVYIPQSNSCAPRYLSDISHLLESNNRPMLGDFNVHHELWHFHQDAFLRLSRQIFMSDSEEDSEQEKTKQNETANTTSVDDENQQENRKKKINGANKNPNEGNCHEDSGDDHNNDGDDDENNSHEKFRKYHKSQKPRTSAALNVNNETITTTTILPQPATSPRNEYLATQISNHNNNRINTNNTSSRRRRMCSSSSDNSNPYDGDILPSSVSSNNSPKKRPCDEEVGNSATNHLADIAILPSTSSSTLSLSAVSASSSSSSSSSYTTLQKLELENGDYNAQVPPLETISSPNNNFPSSSSSSPLKKRKISLNDYIHIRRNSNNLAELEENNNETNNNDIFGLDDHFLNGNVDGDYHQQQQPMEHMESPPQHTTPQRPTNLNNSNNMSSIFLNNSNINSSYLFTPDSGVSLNNSLTTPSTIEHNDDEGHASTSRFMMAHHRLSPCLEEEDGNNPSGNNQKNNNHEEDEGVVTLKIQRYQQKLSRYEQKLARVRRNYRKQFVDDSESE
ncbi:uncharacterized protein DDB_G0271670-like [Musca vetustissima]|uniref:uncharacterized protein DDB_G0271670-like n=1 Tax=Musca vetustissima TaxID=27455 RepID=UPI002AB7590E|nr:uncharacterized protein DDB_G0271670-like [Musca vetustissima]